MKRILTGGHDSTSKNDPDHYSKGVIIYSSLQRYSVHVLIFNIHEFFRHPSKIFIYQILLTLYKQYFVNLAAYKRS